VLETAWSRFSAGARPDLRPAYEQMLSTCAFEWLRDLTKLSGRSQGGS
jgi:hypothetical protein